MRRTLIVLIAAIAIISMAQSAQASWLSEMLFGRHDEYHEPGITFAIDQRVPAKWLRDPSLSVKYWKDGDVIYQGSALEIGALIMTGDENGRKFRICISDATSKVDRECKDKKVRNIGGFKVIGDGVGKYGHATLSTLGMESGTYFLYVEAEKARKGDKFGESAITLRITDPLPDAVAALQSAPDETLKQYGLQAHTETVEPQAPQPVQAPTPEPQCQPKPERQPKCEKRSESPQDGYYLDRREERRPNFAHGATIFLGHMRGKDFVRVRKLDFESIGWTVKVGSTLIFRQNDTEITARVCGINQSAGRITATTSEAHRLLNGRVVVKNGDRR